MPTKELSVFLPDVSRIYWDARDGQYVWAGM